MQLKKMAVTNQRRRGTIVVRWGFKTFKLVRCNVGIGCGHTDIKNLSEFVIVCNA